LSEAECSEDDHCAGCGVCNIFARFTFKNPVRVLLLKVQKYVQNIFPGSFPYFEILLLSSIIAFPPREKERRGRCRIRERLSFI
jgi:hypothetical protein